MSPSPDYWASWSPDCAKNPGAVLTRRLHPGGDKSGLRGGRAPVPHRRDRHPAGPARGASTVGIPEATWRDLAFRSTGRTYQERAAAEKGGRPAGPSLKWAGQRAPGRSQPEWLSLEQAALPARPVPGSRPIAAPGPSRAPWRPQRLLACPQPRVVPLTALTAESFS